MTEIGKNAPGLRGFPTPNNPADTAAYLLFYFNDPYWSQYVIGALRTLTEHWNWYEAGDMSPSDAALAFMQIIQDAPLNLLPSADECALPDGAGRLLRLGAAGHTEMQDGSDWVEPTGDYAIPPLTAREGGTADEQNCLAAANAAHVLELLYEQLSDDWNAGLATAEAIADAVTLIGGLIGAPFGLAAEALIAIARLLFQVVYETLDFIGADVWTTGFTDALRQVLVCCASNDEGVVTFDFQCVLDALARQTNPFDLSFAELRLFGQLYFILQWVGADGLNAAGETTAITSASCDPCTWCHTFDFTVSDGGWEAGQNAFTGLDAAVYSAGVGWTTVDQQTSGGAATGYSRFVQIKIDFSSAHITHIEFETTYVKGTFDSSAATAAFIQSPIGTNRSTTAASGIATGAPKPTWDGAIDESSIQLFLRSSNRNVASYTGNAVIRRVTVKGTGDNPFGDNNCP